jgi:uncharacterized protein with gpF-like domain
MFANIKQISRFRRGRISAQKELRKQLRIRNNLERQLFKRLTSLFGKFINTRAYLYKEFGQFEIAIASRDLELELTPILLQHYRKVFKAIFEENNKANILEQKDDVLVFERNKDLEPFLEEYFRTRNLILVGITNNIAKRIDRVIRRGRRVGLTLPEIAANIEKIRSLARPRAATIARTETHNAAGHAHHRYYQEVEKDYGAKLKKKWVATSDGRTRSSHAAMNLQEPIDMNDTFLVGGTRMKHTGDPDGGPANNVNCRCVIIYVDEQDVVSN